MRESFSKSAIAKMVAAALVLVIVIAGAGAAIILTSQSPSPSPSPSQTPSPSPTATPSPSSTPTPTPSPSPSASPTPTSSPTPTPPKNLTDQILDQCSLARDLFSVDKSAWDNVVKVASINGSDLPKNLAYQVLKQIEGDSRVIDKALVAKRAFEILNDLGIYNLNQSLSVCIPGNYSEALNQLPKHGNNDIMRLFNASEKNQDIIDFSPIVFKSVNSSDVYITPVPARETWTVVDVLKAIKDSGFDIENHPEMFLGLNGKIIANNWCIFDSPSGIANYEKYVNNRTLTLTDQDVKDLMLLQWNLYSQFAPQLNGSSLLYNRDFPWYNGTALKALYPDKNELRAALFNLFPLATRTWSIKDGKMVFGVEGAKIDLSQSFDEYQIISDKHRSIVIDESEVYKQNFPISYDTYKSLIKIVSGNPSEGDLMSHWDYWQWLGDRYYHGLSGTANRYKTLDQFLKENWGHWGFVRDIMAYISGDPKTGGEVEGIEYVIPGALRMAGFPVNHINIEPTPLGAANREWAVTLPPYIVESMSEHFPNAYILFGPGRTFGLHSCGNGLIDDGIKEVYVMLGDSVIYLMKGD
jgi:hypothetical protein